MAYGVVIGETAIIGDDCLIYHQATLGTTGKEKTFKRHPTIGNNVMVGSNTNFVAPVKIGDNAFIGAGSTITDDVPEYALAIARQRQLNKENWNKRN